MTNEQNSTQPQEIDLLEIFARIGKGLKNIIVFLLKGILFLIVFAIKRIHYLIGFVIVGALIGFVLFKSTKRYYSSDLVAQPNGITSTDMVSYINDLHNLCEKNNASALAYALQMKDSTAKKIKDIQAFYIIDLNHDGIGDMVDFKNTYNPKDTSQRILENRIYVRVEVYDNKAFANVRNGLFRYLRSNTFVIKQNEIRKEQLKELISQCENEMSKLDSLQKTEYFGKYNNIPVKGSQMMFLSEQQKPLYYEDMLKLVGRKQYYQKELELATDAFTIIKDFTNLTVAENPKGKYIIKFGAIFGVLGYIILLLLKYRKSITKFIAS